MSLPSEALFFKNGNVVGRTFINIGWVVTERGIIDCCYEAYNYCLDEEKRDTNEHPWAFILDEWKAFDHILLYSHIVPRKALDDLFLNNITRNELEQRFRDGSYRKEFSGWLTSKHLKAATDKFNDLIKEKYGDII